VHRLTNESTESYTFHELFLCWRGVTRVHEFGHDRGQSSVIRLYLCPVNTNQQKDPRYIPCSPFLFRKVHPTSDEQVSYNKMLNAYLMPLETTKEDDPLGHDAKWLNCDSWYLTRTERKSHQQRSSFRSQHSVNYLSNLPSAVDQRVTLCARWVFISINRSDAEGTRIPDTCSIRWYKNSDWGVSTNISRCFFSSSGALMRLATSSYALRKYKSWYSVDASAPKAWWKSLRWIRSVSPYGRYAVLKEVPNLSCRFKSIANICSLHVLFICLEERAVGIYSRTLVQKLPGNFYGVDDDDVLSEYTRVHDITWHAIGVKLRYWQGGSDNLPCFSLQSVYVSQGRETFMSKALPTNGSKRGPGGSDSKLEFLLIDLHARTRGTDKTAPYKARCMSDGMIDQYFSGHTLVYCFSYNSYSLSARTWSSRSWVTWNSEDGLE